MNFVPRFDQAAFLWFGIPLTLLSALPAQTSQAAPVAIDRVPIHSAAPDSGHEYGTWAAGRSYKVSFHDAPTFVPYLGRAVEVDRTLGWRTESVGVGTSVRKTNAEPIRWHDDYRYEYRHGGGVVEAYDVLPEGLEQTFVFANRPAGAGDLSVVGHIDTNLSCDLRERPSHGALEFTEVDGTPRVRYGEAIAFDADGRVVDVETSFDGDRITLTVPGAWLETTRFPVTIDPLWTRRLTASGSDVHESVDVARNDNKNTLLTAYARLSSVTNWDVFAVLRGDDPAPVPEQLVFSDLGNWNTPWCHVASSGDDYCVAFQRNLAVQGRRVRLHFHDAEDYSITTSVASTPTQFGFDDYLPDIGGNADVATSRFLLVWQRDDQMDRSTSSVFGRFVTPSLVDTEFVIASGSSDVERPSVNQLTRATETYMVAYQRDPSGPAPWWCEGRMVSPNGVSSAFWASSRNGSLAGDDPVGFPQVAGADGRFLVSTTISATAALSSAGFGKEVVVERVDWITPGARFLTSSVETAIGPFAGNRVRVGGVAYDDSTRSHWMMTSDQNHDHGGNGYGTVQLFGYQGLEVESATIQTAGSSSVQTKAGGVTFDDDRRRYTFGWAVEDSSASRSWVWTNRWEYPDLTPSRSFGTRCGSTVLQWDGSRQLGSQFGGVWIFGAPLSQSAVVLLSLHATQLDLDSIGMTDCDLLVSTAPGSFIASIPTSTGGLVTGRIVEIPIPENFPPTILQAQCFHLAPGANPLGVQSTQRVEAPIGL